MHNSDSPLGLYRITIYAYALATRDQREPAAQRGVPHATVERMQALFPNVPLEIIRAEMARAGNVDASVERLLAISSQYPAVVVSNTATIANGRSSSDVEEAPKVIQRK